MTRNHSFSFSFPKQPIEPVAPTCTDLINDLFAKLHQQINKVQVIVQSSVIKKQSIFLTAYRKQMFQIRQDLKQLKNSESAIQHQKINNQLRQTIKGLKEEVMEMFIKLDQKSKELDETRIKLDHQVKGNKFLEQQIKKLMRRVKVNVANNQLNIFPTEFRIKEKHIDKEKASIRLMNITTSNYSISTKQKINRVQSTEQRINKITNNQFQTKQILEIINEKEKTQRRSLSNSRKVWQRKYTGTNLYERTELENLFFECATIVHNRIKRVGTGNGSGNAKSLTMHSGVQLGNFRDQEKEEIIRMFLGDSKVINKLYQSVFDGRGEEGRMKSAYK